MPHKGTPAHRTTPLETKCGSAHKAVQIMEHSQQAKPQIWLNYDVIGQGTQLKPQQI
jgi:hypothetical protein